MHHLATGQFYGQTNRLVQLDGLTLTDTEYTHDYVDWHYHENAYFTFILAGSVVEGNRQEMHHCPAGTLLYHHWQEPHYNQKPPGFTRGLHVELSPAWFEALAPTALAVQGSLKVRHPAIKNAIYLIFKELQLNDEASPVAIQSLLSEAMQHLLGGSQYSTAAVPPWVGQVRDLLHDTPEVKWTLSELGRTLGIHPAHLSRSFPTHFGCTLGHYLRLIKVQWAVTLLFDRTLSLQDIALACGFFDQSHFIRCFKAIMADQPARCRKLLLR
jgi:AraC family transcriptional regulator